MNLHADLLFALSHYTEAVVEDLASRRRDALETALYDSLLPTLDHVTSFDVFSRITETLLRYLEHDRPAVQHRMLQIIQRIIGLLPPSTRSLPPIKKDRPTQ
jgi:hypothetical protein